MANTRAPVAAIDPNSSFPFGEDKCVVLDGFIVDGTVMDGIHVKLDTTTLNQLVQCGDNEQGLGILVFDPAWGVAKGTAPTAGYSARVCVHGPVTARLTIAADNVMGGASLCADAAGVLGVPGDGDSNVATLLDRRALNAATASEHIIMYRGRYLNST